MGYPRQSSELCYVDAQGFRTRLAPFEAIDVRDAANERLGLLDGFIVAAQSGRPYHAAIDSGGWFKSRQLLIPVGHLRLDEPGKLLRVDLARDTLARYPAFDLRSFLELTDDQLWRFEERTLAACCPREADLLAGNPRTWGYDRWEHFHAPAWWSPEETVDDEHRPPSADDRRGEVRDRPPESGPHEK